MVNRMAEHLRDLMLSKVTWSVDSTYSPSDFTLYRGRIRNCACLALYSCKQSWTIANTALLLLIIITIGKEVTLDTYHHVVLVHLTGLLSVHMDELVGENMLKLLAQQAIHVHVPLD